MSLIPKKFFLVKGKGFSVNSELLSFEQALRDAGIEKYNLVKVSSIIPPYCIEITNEKGLKQLKPGQIIFSVLSKISSKKMNDLICSSIGVAKPTNQEFYGYLSEQHSIGENPNQVGEMAENLAAEMLATTLGIDFNPESNYDKKKEIFKINGKIIETKNKTEFITVRMQDEWATVITAAIFVL